MRNTIETYLPTLTGRGLETIELAFFGGSFTGLSIAEQSAFLTVAKEYKDAGLIDKIHMSTRPDYIDRDILDNLKTYHPKTSSSWAFSPSIPTCFVPPTAVIQ